MTSFFVNRYTFGMWQTNCYVVGNADTNDVFIIDPGQYGLPTLTAAIQEQEYNVKAVLLTHGHLDHTWSAPDLQRAFPDISIRLHHEDAWMWEDPPAAISTPRFQLDQVGYAWDLTDTHIETFTGGDVMTIAGVRLEVVHTPGHTRGSSSFVTRSMSEDPVMFSGDFIFAGAIGRTDLPSGSADDMRLSIQNVALTMPDATLLAPGHGEMSTIGQEKQTNPYL